MLRPRGDSLPGRRPDARRNPGAARRRRPAALGPARRELAAARPRRSVGTGSATRAGSRHRRPPTRRDSWHAWRMRSPRAAWRSSATTRAAAASRLAGGRRRTSSPASTMRATRSARCDRGATSTCAAAAIIGHGEGALIAVSVAIADPAIGAVGLVGAPARPMRDVLRRGVAQRSRTGADRRAPCRQRARPMVRGAHRARRAARGRR